MNYKKSRDAAWQLLIKNKTSSLPVDLRKICRSEHIRLFSYAQGAKLIRKLGLEDHTVENDAFSIGRVILYDDRKPIARQRFSVAHEIGHILLHSSNCATVYNREPSPNDDPIEAEANVFASRLLAPLCVLHYLNIQTAEEIAETCGISITAAKIRLERLQEIRERDKERRSTTARGCFLLSPLEREAFRLFADYIQKNCKG